MKNLEFKTNINSPYLKVIRFIGTFLLGMVAGSLLIKLKNGSELDWLNTFTAITCSSVIAFFPWSANK